MDDIPGPVVVRVRASRAQNDKRRSWHPLQSHSPSANDEALSSWRSNTNVSGQPEDAVVIRQRPGVAQRDGQVQNRTSFSISSWADQRPASQVDDLIHSPSSPPIPACQDGVGGADEHVLTFTAQQNWIVPDETVQYRTVSSRSDNYFDVIVSELRGLAFLHRFAFCGLRNNIAICIYLV